MRYHDNDKWIVYGKRADFYETARRFQIDPVTARVLRNRDICTEEEIGLFLNGTLRELYDPALLPDGQKAAELLESGSLSVTEVAALTGFNDINNFTRIFKHAYGATPSEYRKRHMDRL